MLEALTPGERTAEIHRRCATLRMCLPSLSYVHIPHLPSAVVDLACHVGRQGGDTESHGDDGEGAGADSPEALEGALICCLAHPHASVREATLKQLLAVFWQDTAAPVAPRAAQLADEVAGSAADEEAAAAVEADVAAVLAADAAAAAEEELTALVELMLASPRLLRVLVDTSLYQPPPLSGGAAAAADAQSSRDVGLVAAAADEQAASEAADAEILDRHASLAQALLLSLVPEAQPSQLLCFTPLLPLLQAHLKISSGRERPGHEGGEEGGGGGGAGGDVGGGGDDDDDGFGEDEDRVLARQRAVAAASHAESLLALLLQSSGPQVRLAALLRLTLHASRGVAAQALRVVAVTVGVHLPEEAAWTPFEGLEDVPRRHAHDGLVGSAASMSTTSDPAGQVSMPPAELDNLFAILPTSTLEPRIRIAAAEQLAKLARAKVLHNRIASGASAAEDSTGGEPTAPAAPATLLSDLAVVLDTALIETHEVGQRAGGYDGERGDAQRRGLEEEEIFACTVLDVLTALFETSHVARTSYLASTPALALLARCALHPSGPIRATLRRALCALLFDAVAATEAAAVSRPDGMPHLVQFRRRPPAAPMPPHEPSSPLAAAVSRRFKLPPGYAPRVEPSLALHEVAGLAPDRAIASSLACRRALREALAAHPDLSTSASLAAILADPAAAALAQSSPSIRPAGMALASTAEDAVLRQVARLAPHRAAADALARLDSCTDHAACTAAIRELHAISASYEVLLQFQASSTTMAVDAGGQSAGELLKASAHLHPVVAALLAHPPTSTLLRLLTIQPATEDDDALLVALLALFTRSLRAQSNLPLATHSSSVELTAPQWTSWAPSRLSTPASPPPACLIEQLVSVGFVVLDRTADGNADAASIASGALGGGAAFGTACMGGAGGGGYTGSAPSLWPRAALRSALLTFGCAMLDAYPALAVRLAGADDLLPLLVQQCARLGMPNPLPAACLSPRFPSPPPPSLPFLYPPSPSPSPPSASRPPQPLALCRALSRSAPLTTSLCAAATWVYMTGCI